MPDYEARAARAEVAAKRRGRIVGAILLVVLALVALVRFAELSMTAAGIAIGVVFVLGIVGEVVQNRPDTA
jgi:hypothetical protein